MRPGSCFPGRGDQRGQWGPLPAPCARVWDVFRSCPRPSVSAVALAGSTANGALWRTGFRGRGHCAKIPRTIGPLYGSNGAILMKTCSLQTAVRPVLALLLSLAWVGSCGGNSPLSDASLPACTWSPSFEPATAAPGQCRAARTYLSCQGAKGDGMSCLSTNVTECPGQNTTPGMSYSECADQCHSDEYALACGGLGPGPWPQPPAACRTLPSGPGGGSISCCPCGL